MDHGLLANHQLINTWNVSNKNIGGNIPTAKVKDQKYPDLCCEEKVVASQLMDEEKVVGSQLKGVAARKRSISAVKTVYGDFL